MVKGGKLLVLVKTPKYVGLGIFESNTAQVLTVFLGDVAPGRCDGLIADAGCLVHFGLVNALGVINAFGAGHKEGACMHFKHTKK